MINKRFRSQKASRYSTSRQKACRHCAKARAKCDRKTSGCNRCVQRDLTCSYPQTHDHEIPGRRTSSEKTVSPYEEEPSLSSNAEQDADLDGTNVEIIATQSFDSPDLDSLDFSTPELACSINADDLSSRWLNPYVPVLQPVQKTYPPRVATFINAILNSYATAAVHGFEIPFVHRVQLAALPAAPSLSACISLAKAYGEPGSSDRVAAVNMIQREMASIYRAKDVHDGVASLVAFQSYLVYSMLLFFCLGQGTGLYLRQAIMNLFELACCTSRCGTVCRAEQNGTRPRWEDWIVVEAKRRTIFALYLFDSLISVRENLPTFLGTELVGLLAPSNGKLWRARCRREWELAYDAHSAEWAGCMLTIDELWPASATATQSEIARRAQRVAKWLTGVDEFGTMLYAVTSITHGG